LSEEEKVSNHKVTIFKQYPFELGQKIRIEESRRGGDWEVVGLSERKVVLRCPVSHKQVEWDLFCYFVEETDNSPWPMEK